MVGIRASVDLLKLFILFCMRLFSGKVSRFYHILKRVHDHPSTTTPPQKEKKMTYEEHLGIINHIQ